MSRRSDPRRGSTLVLVLVMLAASAMLALALVRSRASDARGVALTRRQLRAAFAADSLADAGMRAIGAGAWRPLRAGDTAATGVSGDGTWRLLRPTWGQLLLHLHAERAGGARSVGATVDHRLRFALRMPPLGDPGVALESAESGAPSGVVVPATRSLHETICLAGRVASPEGPATWRPDSLPPLPVVDADTVRDTIRGAVRLLRPVRRPISVVGLLAVDSALVLDADLLVHGLLLVSGPVAGGAGRLSVVGGVRMVGAARTLAALAPSSRIQHDACAIRRAADTQARVQSAGLTGGVPSG
jgi:hypothetical protein